ncbi:MAG: glucan biosynthesis protein D, partial [Polyangiales bacterium]
MMRRRTFVRSTLATAAVGMLARPNIAAAKPTFGQPFAFSFDSLIERARKQAAAPYKQPYRPAPEIT